MRVGVLGPRWPDSLADNILDALPDLGVEPVELGPLVKAPAEGLIGEAVRVAAGLTAGQQRRSQRSTARRVRAADCDLVINVHQDLHADTVRAIRAGGSTVVLWYPDAVANVGRLSMFEAPYDALFLKDPLLVHRTSQIYGTPSHYLPEACNPRWHRPTGTYGTERHVAVVGNVYPTRGRLLRRLVADGIPIRIYGGRLPRSGEFDDLLPHHAGHSVHRLEKSQVFRSAVAVLNNLHPAEMTSVNCRLFEATAAGAVVLCENRPALSTLFVPGQEVVAFDRYEELLERCAALLTTPGWAVEVADRAARRAADEHTYQHRLARILELTS